MTAGIPAVGGVRPPETVKNPLPVVRLDRFAGVEHADLPLFSLRFQADLDASARIGIFQGVGQQNHGQLLDHFLVAEAVDPVRYVDFQRLSRLIDRALKGQRHIQNGMAEVEALHIRPGVVPVHAGQGQEIAYQRVGSPDLGTDIFQVLVFSDLLLEDFGVGRDYGERGLQLVTGIRDELLLAGEGVLDRLDHLRISSAASRESRRQATAATRIVERSVFDAAR